MSKVCLVTGSNGHLGNNVVRQLLAEGYTVKAGVRNTSNTEPFAGLDCELVHADILDQHSMEQALKGVDVLFQVAAVFKHWAVDPENEIVQANIRGTEIALDAAAAMGVKQVVYVSSVAAVGHNGEPLSEETWNADLSNPYYRSKILSERKAWEVSKKHGLWMASVLPGAMIGPNCHALTPTMGYIELVSQNKLPIDAQFFFNFVDVRDVASGAILAMQNGQSGERYILANTQSSGLSDIVSALNEGSSKPAIKDRPKAPKWLLIVVAKLQEIVASFTQSEPELTVSQVDTFFGVRQEYSISKATAELGYAPRSPAHALQQARDYLESR